MKTDALVEDFKAGLASKGGYVKTVRTVCKSEWAYELSVVFKDLDSFKAFAGADGVKPLIEKARTHNVRRIQRAPLAALRDSRARNPLLRGSRALIHCDRSGPLKPF